MLKYVDSIKPKILTNKDKILIKGNQTEIQEEENYYLREITDNMNNLAIHSDSDFKVKNKSYKSKPNMRYQSGDRIKDCQNNTPLQTVTAEEDVEFVNNFLRIECKYINESTTVQFNEEIEDYVEEHEHNETELKICASGNNYLGNDLNSLLIMMALPSKSNNEENHNNHRYNNPENKLKYRTNTPNTEENVDVSYVPLSSRSKIDEDVSNFLCVAPMRIKISEREETILKKYVDKWRIYVSFKKEQLSQQRKAALDNFLDKLAKKKTEINVGPESMKKAKLIAHDFNTYQRRYELLHDDLF